MICQIRYDVCQIRCDVCQNLSFCLISKVQLSFILHNFTKKQIVLFEIYYIFKKMVNFLFLEKKVKVFCFITVRQFPSKTLKVSNASHDVELLCKRNVRNEIDILFVCDAKMEAEVTHSKIKSLST
jgi:hypothetical protein